MRASKRLAQRVIRVAYKIHGHSNVLLQTNMQIRKHVRKLTTGGPKQSPDVVQKAGHHQDAEQQLLQQMAGQQPRVA